MTEADRAKLIALLTELRDAIPVKGTRPEDLVPFRKLGAVFKFIEAIPPDAMRE